MRNTQRDFLLKIRYNTNRGDVMEIIRVSPRGYCKGVVRAINIAKETARKYPDQKIYVLGMLVHNQYVMKALESLQIQSIDDKHASRYDLLDNISEGVVIFTAHGIGDNVIQKAKAKGLLCVDASCPDVKQTQEMIKNQLQQDYDILYIGKKGHPEAEAVTSISNDHIHLVTSSMNIPELSNHKIFVTNQTTMSIFEIESIFDKIHHRYPHAVFCEEICNATRIRQEAIVSLKDQNVDCLLVVGDRFSNNSQRLAQIAKEQQIPKVFLIDSVQDIQLEWLSDVQRIAVTSGASTPTYLTNQVIETLENYNATGNLTKATIDIHRIL